MDEYKSPGHDGGSGVIYDKKVPVKLKSKLYTTVVNRRWCMGVSVGHCASMKNSVYIPPK